MQHIIHNYTPYIFIYFNFGAPGWTCTTDVSNVKDLQSSALATRHTDAYNGGRAGV